MVQIFYLIHMDRFAVAMIFHTPSLRFALTITLGLMTLPSSAQFFLNGNAVQVNDSCYQLTMAQNNQVGSIWNPDKINLNESFDVVMSLFLGTKDDFGADGIVFGFQPISTSIGVAGGGIGFSNISPSLGIEIDTWQNLDLNDPTFDHIAIIQNGNLNHASVGNLSGPVQASANKPNIEDGLWYDLRVSWDASAQRLDVYFDCELRLTYTSDIVNTIFGGDPEVFWGFTAATGGANNDHQICFTYTTFLNELEDLVMCPGGQIELEATGGISYHWTPETGLSNPFIANPLVSPSETTTYTVEIIDECNRPFFNVVTVTIAGDSVFFDLGPDTTLCELETLTVDASSSSAEYLWSTGATSSDLTISNPGVYDVTVTKTDTFCVANDRIRVDYLPLPQADLGPNQSLCRGDSTTLYATFPDADYRWPDGSAIDSFVVSVAGNYELAVTNTCGTVTDIVNIAFEECNDVYFPNAFSPNDDGRNDVFVILDGGDVTEIHLFRIFDRWGALLFEASNFLPNDRTYGWDGFHRGKAANQGIYTYFADISFRDGKRLFFTGDVLLVK